MYGTYRFSLSLILSLTYISVSVDLASAQAEGVVRGQILAATDGSAIARASVTLRRSAIDDGVSTTTDSSGRFTFVRVNPGDYVLVAAAPGFATREARLTLEPRETRAVNLALEIGLIAVDVDVSGRLSEASGTHSPGSTVLTRQRLDALPAAERVNLPEALISIAPGMIRGHDDFVHVRGHEVALNPMINGVSFWENPHSVFSGGISPEVIQTANVMTGGFPAEYGNRFGGVVDIVTKSGFHMRDRGSASLTGGEAGRRSLSAEFGGAENRFAYYLFGTAFASDRFLSPPDPQAIHDSAYGGHVFVQLDRAFDSSAVRAVLMGDGVNFQIPRTPLDLVLRPLAEADQRTRQQTLILGFMRGGADTYVSTSVYQRWSRSRLLPASGPLTAKADLDRELLTIGGKADITQSVGRHTIKAGVDGVRLQPHEALSYDYAGYRELTHLLALSHIHVEGNAISFAGRQTGGQLSAYAQDNIELGSRVTADLGVRVDHHSLVESTTHVSPRVNFAIRTGESTVLHGSYNHFFVPPPIEGILSSGAGLTRFIAEIGGPLPALQPTLEDQVELGVTRLLHPFQVAVTGYFRASEDPVHTTVSPDSRIYSYASFDRARAYGLEVKAEAPGLARKGLAGFLNYALGRVHFYNPVTAGFVTEAGHVTDTGRFLAPMDQTHTLTGGLTYTHAESGFWIGAVVEYGSGTPIGHGEGDHDHAEGADPEHDHGTRPVHALTARIPGHTTANLSGGVDLLRNVAGRSRLSLQVEVENIANQPYLIAQDGEFSATQFSNPRLVSLSVRFRF